MEFLNLFYIWSIGNGLEIFRDGYRKIPKVSPGAHIFQRPFLRSLFFWGGLIIGEAYVRRKICVSKSIGLACNGREIYHFCFVLLCIGGQIPSTSPRGAYILIFRREITWRGLFSEFLRYLFFNVLLAKLKLRPEAWSQDTRSTSVNEKCQWVLSRFPGKPYNHISFCSQSDSEETVTNFLSFFLSFLPSFFFDTFYNLNFTFISADKAVKNIAFPVFMLFLTLSVIEHFGR